MTYGNYILVGFIFASLFFIGSAAALYWAHKNGQLSNLEDGAKSIFDEEEPVDSQTDVFPKKSSPHIKEK